LSLNDELEEGRQKKKTLTDLQKQLQAAESEHAEADQNLLTALSSTENYLARNLTRESCPVCEQSISAQLLRDNIARRLSEFRAYGNLVKEVTAAERAYGAAEDGYRRSINTAAKCATDALSSVSKCLPFLGEASNQAIEDASRAIEESQGAAKRDGIIVANDLCSTYAERLSSTLDRVSREYSQHTMIRQQLSKMKSTRAEMRQEDALSIRLSKILAVVQKVRKEYTNAVLASVTDHCQSLYELIHPGERIGISSFALDDKQRASVKQVCSFEGQTDIAPQAYFSEAHLDTLGFVLWLALAQISTDGDTILVLDDVFTSADAPHLNRVIRLLSDHCQIFNQIIIATHNRTWQAHYQHDSSQVHLLELNEWSMSRGITTTNVLPNMDELYVLRNTIPFDRQGIASKAGILLEHRLNMLALQYQCSLPHRRERHYTLGELQDGVTKKVKEIRIVKPLMEGANPIKDDCGVVQMEEIKLKDVFDGFASLGFIRNRVGAHHNEWGDDIANNDIRLFADQSLAFAKALICPVCLSMPVKRGDASLQCSCKMTNMTPLPTRGSSD